MMGRWTYLGLGCWLTVACGQDDGADVDTGLSAELIAVSTAELDPADDALDDVTLTVAYRDGDGNLGGGVAEVHDCRAEGLVTRLEIPAIANEAAVAAQVPIFGELSLTVPDVGLVQPDAQAPGVCGERGTPRAESVVFCVQLVDLAEERSAAVCSDPIAVLQPAG